LQLQHVGINAVLSFPGILCAGDLPIPHTTGRLLALRPGIAKLLAVVTLRETSLGFVRLYRESFVAKTRQFEYLVGL
jgi:hypothetical protein